jgi:hypothetical protein
MVHVIAGFSSEMLLSITGWIASIIAFAVFLGFLYVIGQSGTTMRRGIELAKALPDAKKKAQREGTSIDPQKYNRLRRKAVWMTILPPLLWTLIYAAVFKTCPLSYALWSLLLLIAPILGFFGIFFVPDTEP